MRQGEENSSRRLSHSLAELPRVASGFAGAGADFTGLAAFLGMGQLLEMGGARAELALNLTAAKTVQALALGNRPRNIWRARSAGPDGFWPFEYSGKV